MAPLKFNQCKKKSSEENHLQCDYCRQNIVSLKITPATYTKHKTLRHSCHRKQNDKCVLKKSREKKSALFDLLTYW